MKKTNLFTLLFSLFSLSSYSQNPISGTGPWNQNSNVSQSTTLHDAGVGTTSPIGKLEVKYQPCVTQQNGLVVTSLGCNSITTSYNPVINDGVIQVDLNGPSPQLPPLVFNASYAVTTLNIPIINANNKPMFWVRDENPPSQAYPGMANNITYGTKFIIMPNGNTGVNTSNPRATIDVVQFSAAPRNEPTAVFGKINGGTQTVLSGTDESGNPVSDPSIFGYRTKQIMVYNNLGAKSYNRIVQDKDQAILFTDGLNPDGSNSDGALVIAPWDPNYSLNTSTIGGIRIDKNGKVEIHGDLRATKVVVEAKWWSDFVFDSKYSLLSIDSVYSYIKLNGHLPGMPSESEIISNGLNVSDILALQQQKIEELTLYNIQQYQLVQKLQTYLSELDAKINTLEVKLSELKK